MRATNRREYKAKQKRRAAKVRPVRAKAKPVIDTSNSPRVGMAALAEAFCGKPTASL